MNEEKKIIPKPSEYFRSYSKYLFHLLANLDFNVIEKVTNIIIECSQRGGTVFFAGNGGSAASASHFATDFSHGIKLGERPLINTVSLTDNVALLTAISNDHGYENVFVNQMQSLFHKGDLLVAISASGNSPNVIKAVNLAKEKGGITIGLTGFDGGKLSEICDYVIHVETEKGKYGPVEDIHIVLDHMISSYLGLVLKEKHENT